MKKVKIMLLSLAVFAVVGGALAFNTKFNKKYCTTDFLGGPCPIDCPIWTSSTTVGADVLVCYTDPVGNNCINPCVETPTSLTKDF